MLLAIILECGAITNSKKLIRRDHLFSPWECWISGVCGYKKGKKMGETNIETTILVTIVTIDFSAILEQIDV